MQRLLIIFILILAGLVQSGCQSKDGESILVIAVDDLAATDITCSKENINETHSGFDLLCKESVRFTHAFSPSTMAVPALSSIMTGLYPFEHGVHHNGQFLQAKEQTVAEYALTKNYRTAFFSGGAPVLRKVGINQGFEVFDDSIVPDLTSLFRPLSKSVDAFKAWMKQEVESAPFFASIYAPDLIFTNTATVSDLGEPRNLTYESQLDELNNSLYNFFRYLKETNRWDSTTIILTGLNGHTNSDRPQEAAAINLHSESTQVVLLVKSAQKKRDNTITWKIDKNISLTDLGQTLFDLLGRPKQEPRASDFPTESLKNLLHQPEEEFNEERPLITESGWGLWKGLSNLRSAVLKNHVLFINDEPVTIYNTLVDRLETNPLPSSDSYTFSPYTILETLRKNQYTPWTGVSAATVEKLNLNFSNWAGTNPNTLLLKELRRLNRKFPLDPDFLDWAAYVALENKDWAALKDLGTRDKNNQWIYVAEKNLGPTKLKTYDPCLKLLKDEVLDVGILKSCNDPLMLDLIDWVRSDVRGLSREVQRKKFARSYRIYRTDLHVRRSNIGAGMIWDINKDLPLTPSTVDLALNLPEYQKIRSQVDKSLRGSMSLEE